MSDKTSLFPFSLIFPFKQEFSLKLHCVLMHFDLLNCFSSHRKIALLTVLVSIVLCHI
jgi:hypothetical protein